MATISVRRLDANYEPVYGQGQLAFLTDLDAVAQIILTTVRLLEGEWWEDVTQGTPLFQTILGTTAGQKALQASSAALQARIESVPFVTSLSNVSASFSKTDRTFSFSCLVQTQFGTLQVSNAPGLSAAVAAVTI